MIKRSERVFKCRDYPGTIVSPYCNIPATFRRARKRACVCVCAIYELESRCAFCVCLDLSILGVIVFHGL